MRYYSFNRYLKEHFGERVQKVALDAGLTCPNRDGRRGAGGCLYCDSRGSGTGAFKDSPDIRDQAREAMAFLSRRYRARKFIAYFQSFCNTDASEDVLAHLYGQAAALPGVVGLAVGTRPDCLSREALELLAGHTDRLMVWLELGLQTIHDETLQRINRGHSFAEFLEGYRLARQYPLSTCLHVIIGLPGESDSHIHATAREVARLRPEGIKIHSLYIHRNTGLETLYRQGKYRPLSRERFINLVCDFLEIIPGETVVQRLTGDPRPDELVAPAWSLQKRETLQMIDEELDRRGTCQGSKYERPTLAPP